MVPPKVCIYHTNSLIQYLFAHVYHSTFHCSILHCSCLFIFLSSHLLCLSLSPTTMAAVSHSWYHRKMQYLSTWILKSYHVCQVPSLALTCCMILGKLLLCFNFLAGFSNLPHENVVNLHIFTYICTQEVQILIYSCLYKRKHFCLCEVTEIL